MNIKLLTPTSKLPTRATPGAACWDVYANEEATIPAGGRAVVKLGFALEVPAHFEVQIRGRSGLALKSGILAHTGTIDSDYRGEVGAILFNMNGIPFRVEVGDRIAQMAFGPALPEDLAVVAELSETTRGAGGFGSTGV